jgi:hypothetical protein
MIRRKQASTPRSSILSLLDSTRRSFRRSLIAQPSGTSNQKFGHGADAVWKYLGFFMFMIMIVLARSILNIAPDSTMQLNKEQNLRSTTSNKPPLVAVSKNKAPQKQGKSKQNKSDAAVTTGSTKEKRDKRTGKNSPISFNTNVTIIQPRNPASIRTSEPAKLRDESWHVTIAHEPRYDLLGSFVLPTVLLHGVTHFENWTLAVLPFSGSPQHAILTELFAQKGNLTKDWGSGFQDASHRADYNPMELNDKSYETMGFFPKVSKIQNLHEHPWIKRAQIPLSGKELNEACEEGNKKRSKTDKNCYILLSDDPNKISNYIHRKGGIDKFFTPDYCQQLRRQFLLKNHHRLQQYEITATDGIQQDTTKDFNVAVHIRRGDILHPDRWIDQHVFANVARHICQTNTDKNENIRTNIHVFSSGPNRDGNWSIMEQLAQSTPVDGNDNGTIPPICSNVFVHVDEVEFDTWTFMIAADALVISPSTFGYVPSLIRYDNVYYPRKFWHPVLSSFIIFDDESGSIISKA